MNKSLQKVSQDLWCEDESLKEEIRTLYCPTLNENEFKIFLGIGKATGLNPFLREMWAVKYGTNGTASIFIGRDGYRKAAQIHREYDYHQVDAVYEKDDFKIDDGIIQHSYNVADRGVLIGAYCSVKRKSSSKPIFNFVELKEYYLGNKDKNGKIKMKWSKYDKKQVEAKETLWDTKPATMIKKVAEAQALRMAFQDMFAGTYSEGEAWKEEEVSIKIPTPGIMINQVEKIQTIEKLEEALTIFDAMKHNYAQDDATKIDKAFNMKRAELGGEIEVVENKGGDKTSPPEKEVVTDIPATKKDEPLDIFLINKAKEAKNEDDLDAVRTEITINDKHLNQEQKDEIRKALSNAQLGFVGLDEEETNSKK